MAYITPQTNVYLLSGVPLDQTYGQFSVDLVFAYHIKE